MNNIEQQYLDLLKDILENGTIKQTRNGEVISVFGRTLRHDMKLGYPLLTTKKMAFKSMTVELLWFLQGRTDLKYLVDNGCNIWVGDAFSKYKKNAIIGNIPDSHHNVAQDKWNLYNEEEFINMIKKDDRFSRKWGSLGNIYGKQWRRWTKKKMYLSTDGSYENIYDEMDQTVIDQFAILINDLKTNPDSRRLMVSAWNVAEIDSMIVPPCHYAFQVYTRELTYEERFGIHEKYISEDDSNLLNQFATNENLDKLNVPKRAISLMWQQRSVDTPLGLPFNIASYALLLEILAKEVNMVPDELMCNLGDTHIYTNQIDGVKEQLTRTPYALPTLDIKLHFNNEPSFVPEHWLVSDFEVLNYTCHPAIKMPLSN